MRKKLAVIVAIALAVLTITAQLFSAARHTVGNTNHTERSTPIWPTGLPDRGESNLSLRTSSSARS